MPSSFWKVCRFTVHMKMGGFSDFYTLRPVFKKVRFQALHFQDPCGRSAKTMQYMCVFAKERPRVDGSLVKCVVLCWSGGWAN